MARNQLRKTRAPEPIEPDEAETPSFDLDIQIDEREGQLRIFDPRAFHAGRRGFCRRMLEELAGRPDFERAEIELGGASCLLRFDRRSATARAMADASASAVQSAADGPAADRFSWWRRPSRWSALTAYHAPDGPSLWETLDAQPGRIHLRHEALLGDRASLAHLTDALAGLDGIDGCRVSAWSRTLTLDFRPESPVAHRLLDTVERALQDSKAAEATRHGLAARVPSAADGPIEVATGRRRLGYLALAGGSFAMTLVGLVVPGIPTVPFLLATSYYLARSSPRLNDRLRGTALFGPILEEWEQYHGLSGSSKAKLMGLTAVVIAVTVSVSPLSPVILVVILLIASASLCGIARLPAAPRTISDAIGPGRPARLALSAP